MKKYRIGDKLYSEQEILDSPKLKKVAEKAGIKLSDTDHDSSSVKGAESPTVASKTKLSAKDNGNSAKPKSHKVLTVFAIILGLFAALFSFDSIMIAGDDDAGGMALFGIFLGIISIGLGLPKALPLIRKNKKAIQSYGAVSAGIFAVALGIIGTIANPIAKNSMCSKIDNITDLKSKGCDGRAKQLEDKQNAEKKAAEEKQAKENKAWSEAKKKVLSKIAGSTYNVQDSNFCTSHTSYPEMYAKSLHFDDASHATVTYCDGHTATDSVELVDYDRAIRVNSKNLEISDDNSTVYYGSAKYTKDAKAPDNVQKQQTQPSSSSTSAPSSSSSQPTSSQPASSGPSTSFRKVMDDYESFMNKYVDFMKKYKSNPTDANVLSDYAGIMSEYNKYTNSISNYKQDNLSAADWSYYLEVTARVTKKLSEIQ